MISGIIKVEVSVIRLRLITLRDLDHSGYHKPREVWKARDRTVSPALTVKLSTTESP